MSLNASGNLSIDGTLSQGSDRERKEEIEEVDAKAALEKLVDLPIYEWNYIGDPHKDRHIGPMAQDFYAAFALGRDEKSLSPSDVSGVTVVAIQELNRKVGAQEAEIEALRETVSDLQAAVEALVELRDASQ